MVLTSYHLGHRDGVKGIKLTKGESVSEMKLLNQKKVYCREFVSLKRFQVGLDRSNRSQRKFTGVDSLTRTK